MNYKLICLFSFFLVLFSCKKEDQSRMVESAKDAQKKEIIFSNIKKGWVFNAKPINSTSLANTKLWTEWGGFLIELNQKPKTTIGAFQKKAKELSKKVMALENNIPLDLNKPQIKSRINILITKIRMLDLFIHLDNIPDKEVLVLISEINTELETFQNQMEKMAQKSKIPLEEGESELLKMLDTSRAIPNTPIDPNLQRVE